MLSVIAVEKIDGRLRDGRRPLDEGLRVDVAPAALRNRSGWSPKMDIGARASGSCIGHSRGCALLASKQLCVSPSTKQENFGHILHLVLLLTLAMKPHAPVSPIRGACFHSLPHVLPFLHSSLYSFPLTSALFLHFVVQDAFWQGMCIAHSEVEVFDPIVELCQPATFSRTPDPPATAKLRSDSAVRLFWLPVSTLGRILGLGRRRPLSGTTE